MSYSGAIKTFVLCSCNIRSYCRSLVHGKGGGVDVVLRVILISVLVGIMSMIYRAKDGVTTYGIATYPESLSRQLPFPMSSYGNSITPIPPGSIMAVSPCSSDISKELQSSSPTSSKYPIQCFASKELLMEAARGNSTIQYAVDITEEIPSSVSYTIHMRGQDMIDLVTAAPFETPSQTIIQRAILDSNLLHIQLVTEAAIVTSISKKFKTSDYASFSSLVINGKTRRFPEEVSGKSSAPLLLLHILIPTTGIFLYSSMMNEWISFLCEQKRTLMRETLLIGGLKNREYWISWFLSCFLLGLPFVAPLVIALIATGLLQGSVGIILLVHLLMLACTVLISFTASALFSKGNIACLFAILFYAVASFPASYLRDPAVSVGTKVAILALPPSVFVECIERLSAHIYTKNAQTVTSATWVLWGGEDSQEMPFGYLVLALAIDTVLYSMLTIYFDKVITGKHGVRKSIFFCLDLSYLRKTFEKLCYSNSSSSRRQKSLSKSTDEYDALKPKVQLFSLKKSYAGANGPVKALRGLTLDMFEGQITAILGQNGAGKTSTIHILTGLQTPSSGVANVYGHNIIEGMDKIREMVGICPQHDILFDVLTVSEHLKLFARLKGYRGARLKEQVEQVIDTVGLSDKADALAYTLSGGMKRRLSVAIAIVGNPRVLFLDEPTAGVDPLSRRALWDVFIKLKKGRIIVLTTHFMDEADILGDRIAFLRGGMIQAVGSPLLLKQSFCQGYSLNITPGLVFNRVKVLQAIQKVIPDAAEASKIRDASRLLSIILPFVTVDRFPALFASLNDNKLKYGIASYGISVPTLQEVFLKLASVTEEDESDDDKPPEGMLKRMSSLTRMGSFRGKGSSKDSRKSSADEASYGDVELVSMSSGSFLKSMSNSSTNSDDSVAPPVPPRKGSQQGGTVTTRPTALNDSNGRKGSLVTTVVTPPFTNDMGRKKSSVSGDNNAPLNDLRKKSAVSSMVPEEGGESGSVRRPLSNSLTSLSEEDVIAEEDEKKKSTRNLLLSPRAELVRDAIQETVHEDDGDIEEKVVVSSAIRKVSKVLIMPPPPRKNSNFSALEGARKTSTTTGPVDMSVVNPLSPSLPSEGRKDSALNPPHRPSILKTDSASRSSNNSFDDSMLAGRDSSVSISSRKDSIEEASTLPYEFGGVNVVDNRDTSLTKSGSGGPGSVIGSDGRKASLTGVVSASDLRKGSLYSGVTLSKSPLSAPSLSSSLADSSTKGVVSPLGRRASNLAVIGESGNVSGESVYDAGSPLARKGSIFISPGSGEGLRTRGGSISVIGSAPALGQATFSERKPSINELRKQSISVLNVSKATMSHLEKLQIEQDDLGSSSNSILSPKQKPSSPMANNSVPAIKWTKQTNPTFAQHLKVTLWKRFKYATREKKSIIVQSVVPVFIFSAVLIASTTTVNPTGNTHLHPVSLGLQAYSSTNSTIGCYLDTRNRDTLPDIVSEKITASQIFSKKPCLENGNALINAVKSLTGLKKKSFSLLGAYSAALFNDRGKAFALEFHVSYNNSATTVVPGLVSSMTSALIKKFTGKDIGIHGTFESLSDSSTAEVKPNEVDFSWVSVVAGLAISLGNIAVLQTFYAVKEKESDVKLHQMISGLYPVAYWGGNGIWDLASYLFITVPGVVIVLASFRVHFFMEHASPIIALLIMFGAALCPYSYCFSFLFHTKSAAQSAMSILQTFVPTLFLIFKLYITFGGVSISLQQLSVPILQLGYLLPSNALVFPLLDAAVANILCQHANKAECVWEAIHPFLLVLLIQVVVYTMLLCNLEYMRDNGVQRYEYLMYGTKDAPRIKCAPANTLLRRVARFVESAPYALWMIFVICSNCACSLSLVVMAQTPSLFTTSVSNVEIANKVFIVYFLLEFVVIFVSKGPIGYFRDFVHFYDASLVALSIVDLTTPRTIENQSFITFIRVLQSLRLMRVVPFFSHQEIRKSATSRSSGGAVGGIGATSDDAYKADDVDSFGVFEEVLAVRSRYVEDDATRPRSNTRKSFVGKSNSDRKGTSNDISFQVNPLHVAEMVRHQRNSSDRDLSAIDNVELQIEHGSDNAAVITVKKAFNANTSKAITAINDVSFAIREGEIVALLGPNGAGKTTLLEILLGLQAPDAGATRVLGSNSTTQKESISSSIGFCPQFDALIENMTGYEVLYLYSVIRGVDQSEIHALCDSILDATSLKKFADRQVKEYSGGNKRKLSVCIAMIGSPLVLFLDEPTTGMDPVSAQCIWNVIRSYVADNPKRSVVLTTHSMEEADTLCNRIAIMINGNLACIGTSQELKSHYGQGYSLVANMEDMSCQDQLTKLLKSIVPRTHIVELYGNQIKYSIPSNDFSLATMFSALQRDRVKLKIDDYSLTQTTLESLFIDLARRQIVRRWTQVSPFNT